MNLHTFKDAVGSKRASLANDLDEDDDDHDVGTFRENIEGEEEDGEDKFNEAGEAIEPFNMRDERDRGHIDDNMNFVFKREKGEIDEWLAGIDEAAMEKGIGEAQEALRRKEAARLKREEDDAKLTKKSPFDLKLELLTLMQPGETVTRAMNRMSGSKKSQGGKRGPSSQAPVDRASLNRLIEIADQLISHRLVGIYEMTYESIDLSTALWEYQALDGSIQGPFTSQQISGWQRQGFFTGASAVMMRRIPLSGGGGGGGGGSGNGDDRKSGSDHGGSGSGGDSEKASYFGSTKRQRPGDDGAEAAAGVGGGSDSSRSKVAKVEPQNSMDLMDDLDDDDGDDDGDGDPVVGGSGGGDRGATINDDLSSTATTSTPAPAPAPGPVQVVEVTKGPWISSDELDFGAFVDLDHGDERLSSVSGVGNVSTAEMNAVDKRNQEEDDDDDDDDEDEDEDGDSERKDREGKGGKDDRDSDDDDDDDDDGGYMGGRGGRGGRGRGAGRGRGRGGGGGGGRGYRGGKGRGGWRR